MEAAQDLSYTPSIKLLVLISNGGCPKKVAFESQSKIVQILSCIYS